MHSSCWYRRKQLKCVRDYRNPQNSWLTYSPRTSAIEYIPARFPARYLAAASGQVVNLYGRHIERAQHLYLPGARRGVFNPAGARNAEEIIVTESVLDACAVWSAGLRNVLSVYGVNGLTDDIRHPQSFAGVPRGAAAGCR